MYPPAVLRVCEFTSSYEYLQWKYNWNIHCPNPKPPFCTHHGHQNRLVQRHYGKVSDGKPRTLLGSFLLSTANVRVQRNSHEVFSADSLLPEAVCKGCICYEPVAVVRQCAGIWATVFCARQLICRQANLTAYRGGNWEKTAQL